MTKRPSFSLGFRVLQTPPGDFNLKLLRSERVARETGPVVLVSGAVMNHPSRWEPARAGNVLARLPTEEAAPIFERLDDERQAAIVTELGPESIAQIAVEMSSDERADLIKELPEDVGGQVLASLEQIDPLVAEDVEELAQWPEHSAGSLMTTSRSPCSCRWPMSFS